MQRRRAIGGRCTERVNETDYPKRRKLHTACQDRTSQTARNQTQSAIISAQTVRGARSAGLGLISHLHVHDRAGGVDESLGAANARSDPDIA
eukprot:1070843-Rhodomonas_salina.3